MYGIKDQRSPGTHLQVSCALDPNRGWYLYGKRYSRFPQPGNRPMGEDGPYGVFLSGRAEAQSTSLFTHGLETISTVMSPSKHRAHSSGNLQQARLIGLLSPKTLMIFTVEAVPIIYGSMVISAPHPCMSCRNQVPISEITSQVERGQIPPVCGFCAGILKPDVVLLET